MVAKSKSCVIENFKFVQLGFDSDNVRDDPVAANKLNTKTDVKCDLRPLHCYLAILVSVSNHLRDHQSFSIVVSHNCHVKSQFISKPSNFPNVLIVFLPRSLAGRYGHKVFVFD